MSDQPQSRTASFTCPLCRQRVSASLYQKITSIWEARRNALARINAQRAMLQTRFEQKEKKLRNQYSRFRMQRAQLIRKAVEKRTTRLETSLRILRRREIEIKRTGDERLQRATELAHRKAERQWSGRIASLRRRFRASIRDEVAKERGRTTEEIEEKYRRLNNAFKSALTQMQVKDSRLREQTKQIRELQRQLRRETTPQIEGLLYEGKLLTELRKRFPEDRFKHEGKGGDILHWPMRNNHTAGLIVYECKRVQRYLPSYVHQAASAKDRRKADFAILVTTAMKRNTRGLFAEKGVLVVHPAGVVHLTAILRGQIIRIAEMKLGQFQRNKAVKMTMEYLEGPEFVNSIDGIIQQAFALTEDLRREVETHRTFWKRRFEEYKKIYENASIVKKTTRTLLMGDPEGKALIQAQTDFPLLGLPELLPDIKKGAE